MNKMIVPMMLPLLLLEGIIPVTSRLNSVTVTSYRDSKLTENGQVMCALDTANETTSSSSLNHCLLKCARDVACTGVNMKSNAQTCDTYTYKPKIMYLISECNNYEVSSERSLLLSDVDDVMLFT